MATEPLRSLHAIGTVYQCTTCGATMNVTYGGVLVHSCGTGATYG